MSRPFYLIRPGYCTSRRLQGRLYMFADDKVVWGNKFLLKEACNNASEKTTEMFSFCQ
jgi:hypothetical protein